jgi:hypothetical protein
MALTLVPFASPSVQHVVVYIAFAMVHSAEAADNVS